jgi:dienelactone hydrolase
MADTPLSDHTTDGATAHVSVSTTDTRCKLPPADLNTPRDFPVYHTLKEWQARRAAIREQMLVSFGLYPMPPKPPLDAHVFGKIERDGYTIEKVYIQTYPGFYLAGNLYRPRSRGLDHKKSGGHPGILVAHGHGDKGRFTNDGGFSIPARAITFARQGCVAFTYDMVGYNDTDQIHHQYAYTRRHWLWGVTLMGLQTWNSMRALDFLCSLPDVDKSRLAITGESGGGTQTMMLGALDDRLAAVGPCVMVSHTMQGGCLCENAPGLRVDFFNVEIAAVPAPKPQIMVGATGDWTASMMEMEGPSVESIYKLYGHQERLRYVRFPYGHNINQTSRESVDAWFGRWLLGEEDESKLKEPPFTMEPVADLKVFTEAHPRPRDAKDQQQLTDTLIAEANAQIESRRPHDAKSLAAFKKLFEPFWRVTLGLDYPVAESIQARREPDPAETGGKALYIGRDGRGDSIPALLFEPRGTISSRAVVLVHPDGIAHFLPNGKPDSLVTSLREKGCYVLLLDTFLTGSRASEDARLQRKPFNNFFTTYNRTDLQERVQDLVTACAYLHGVMDIHAVTLAGLDHGGLWALLAAPAADSVAVDCARLDLTNDDALIQDDLYTPNLRRMGDFRTAAALAAPHRLLLHNTGDAFAPAAWISGVYAAVNAEASLRVEPRALAPAAVAEWITQ